MTIIETSGYKNSYKKIKNNHDIVNKLEKIITYIEYIDCFDKFEKDEVLKMYGFEMLRGDLSCYYRFGLDKNSKIGKTRLIFSKVNENTIKLEYISRNHYEDFKRFLRG